MKYDHFLARREPAPKDLSNLQTHISRLMQDHQGPRPRDGRRQHRNFLLSNLCVPPRRPDLQPIHAHPVWPGRDRTQANFQSWIETLVMPGACPTIRDAYGDALNVDDPAETAATLKNFDQSDARFVTALLELRIGLAADLMRAWDNNSIEKFVFAEAKDLLGSMLRVRIAYWLRAEATLCASKLRRPLAWFPLDHADRPDMVRYGPVRQRFEREKHRFKDIAKLYRSGAGHIAGLADDEVGAWLERDLGVATWYEDLETSDTRSQTQWNEVAERGRQFERNWKKRHGAKFESILDKQISLFEEEIAKFETNLFRDDELEISYSMQLGNVLFCFPLTHLFHVTRFAIAWTCEVRTDHHTGLTPNPSFTEQIAERLGAAAINCTTLRHPPLNKNHAGRVSEVVAILRYAVVKDNNVIPGALRKHLVSSRDGQLKEVYVKSQFEAARDLGKPFSFAELVGASESDPKRCEIRKRANVRKNKCLVDFEEPMRGAVQESLTGLLEGLNYP